MSCVSYECISTRLYTHNHPTRARLLRRDVGTASSTSTARAHMSVSESHAARHVVSRPSEASRRQMSDWTFVPGTCLFRRRRRLLCHGMADDSHPLHATLIEIVARLAVPTATCVMLVALSWSWASRRGREDAGVARPEDFGLFPRQALGMAKTVGRKHATARQDGLVCVARKRRHRYN